MELALNFSTTIETDLKILLMGDSIGIEFSQTLEEAATTTTMSMMTGGGGGGGGERRLDKDENDDDDDDNNNSQQQQQQQHAPRQVLKYSWSTHEGLHVTAPVNGGGVVAGWRLLGFLGPNGEDKPLPNICCGGWRREDVDQLLHGVEYHHHHHHHHHDGTGGGAGNSAATTHEDDHNYGQHNNNNDTTTSTSTTTTIDSFDVFVFPMPLGWLPATSVTEEALEAAIRTAKELFGAKTVVLVTMPFSYHIQSIQDIENLNEAYDVVRKFADKWRTTTTTAWNAHKNNNSSSTATTTNDDDDDEEHLLVLDFARLGNSLVEWNAQLLGMTDHPRSLSMTRNSITMDSGYILDRLMDTRNTPAVAQVCLEPPQQEPRKCTFNGISSDGLHVCMERLGGRFVAGLACVLGCKYNDNNTTGDDDDDDDDDDEEEHKNANTNQKGTRTQQKRVSSASLRACQKSCNDRFMSLSEYYDEAPPIVSF
jgi:hypothetical protein